MAPWRLASQSEADPDESLESELVSSLESLLESLLLVEDSLPDELELELELEVEDASQKEHNPHQCRAMVA